MMYLQFCQDVTGCGGSVVGNRYHLIDFYSMPTDPEARATAHKQLENLFGWDDNQFIRTTDDPREFENLCNVWCYNADEGVWKKVKEVDDIS
jgi:hypothetical protein